MPKCCRSSFGKDVAVIIDCFEVFVERPSNLLARAITWSFYKHHNTVKVLIGIIPRREQFHLFLKLEVAGLVINFSLSPVEYLIACCQEILFLPIAVLIYLTVSE